VRAALVALGTWAARTVENRVLRPLLGPQIHVRRHHHRDCVSPLRPGRLKRIKEVEASHLRAKTDLSAQPRFGILVTSTASEAQPDYGRRRHRESDLRVQGR
jgi:hypothetical protein